MEPANCYNCKWAYSRRFKENGIRDYFCTWRKYHRKDTNFDNMKFGRIVNISRIKTCKHREEK